MGSSTRHSLVSELARHDRLLEVGIGNRPTVARALAERGCDVVGVDIDVGKRTRAAARDAEDSPNEVRDAEAPANAKVGSFQVIEWDIVSAAKSAGDAADFEQRLATDIDAVYARRLPAELQRSTVDLAARLDATCLFTTLGFEEPVVSVSRRSLPGATLYVAGDGTGPPSRR